MEQYKLYLVPQKYLLGLQSVTIWLLIFLAPKNEVYFSQFVTTLDMFLSVEEWNSYQILKTKTKLYKLLLLVFLNLA